VPILNIQLAAQDPNGNQIAPLVALQQRGPVVQVSVSVHQDIAQQLLAQGLSLPTPERGFALIDTGASSTCIDEGTARRLNLPTIATSSPSPQHPMLRLSKTSIRFKLKLLTSK
jgi:hypothetical protein